MDDPSEAPAAIARLSEIDRRACRAHAEAHLSDARMAAEHEALYRRLVEARPCRGGGQTRAMGDGGSWRPRNPSP